MALMATTRRYMFRSVHFLDAGDHREKIHGHQFSLEVSFEHAEIAEVDRVVNEKVVAALDAHDITRVLSPATGENIVEWIHAQLSDSPLAKNILGVAIQETRKNRFVSARSVVQII